MSKTSKALQVSALLSAVSGATLVMSAASTPVQAAETNRVEEQCWHRQPTAAVTDQYRLRGCLYEQYGLKPGDGGDKGYKPDVPRSSGGGGGPSQGPGYTS